MDHPTRKYIKRQLVLHDIGIEINSEVKSYYDYIKKSFDVVFTNTDIYGKTHYYNKDCLVLLKTKRNDVFIEEPFIIDFSYHVDIKNLHICKDIIKYTLEHILGIHINVVVSIENGNLSFLK